MRRSDFYKVRRGDNLGDPDYWNKRLDDLDVRIDANERGFVRVDNSLDEVIALALSRLDNTLNPLIANSIEQLSSIPSIFSGRSTTSMAVGTGARTFTIIEEDRTLWVQTRTIRIEKAGDPATYMVAKLESYDRETGAAVVDVLSSDGAGTFANWIIWPAGLTGQQGIQGEPGADGADGADGAAGDVSNAGDGTAGAPGFAFSADTDTGFRRSASGTIIAVSDGADELTLLRPSQAQAEAGADNTLPMTPLRTKQAITASNLAPLASPALTGTPTAPSAAAATNTTQIATTAHVKNYVATLLPAGAIVGTTAAQTLTGKTLTGYTETVFAITDAAAFEINPANGTIQTITLGANRTPKATSFAAGQSVTLMVNDGTARTLTWTDATFGGSGVAWVGGTAPTLETSGYTVIELWKVGSQVYGALVGGVA